VVLVMLQDAQRRCLCLSPLRAAQVEKVYAIKCAGAEAKYAPFKRLKNRMLLWKGARESSMASIPLLFHTQRLHSNTRADDVHASSVGTLISKCLYSPAQKHAPMLITRARAHAAPSSVVDYPFCCTVCGVRVLTI